MVAGQSGLGKTTFLKTLFHGLLSPPLEDPAGDYEALASTEAITPYSFEMETVEGTRLQIEAIDTPGYNDDASPETRAEEVLRWVENSFDEVYAEEIKTDRNPKFEEHRIHALLYFIEPTGLYLKAADAAFMKTVASRINIVPIIAKADGLSPQDMHAFKERILTDIKGQGIGIFEIPGEEADGLSSLYSVVGSTFPLPASHKLGRAYPWGFVDVLDSTMCDFVHLQEHLLNEYREDLKDITKDHLYEKYRSEKMRKSEPVQ